METLVGFANIEYQNFYWTYKHWISELLVDIQTLDIRTFTGYRNTELFMMDMNTYIVPFYDADLFWFISTYKPPELVEGSSMIPRQ